MADRFTYETAERSSPLETYEWDSIWFEHADDFVKKRVLIIGDSISCGYRSFVNKRLGGKLYADGIGTSKAPDNPAYIALIEYVLSQRSDYSLVQFNFGLHGWHLDDGGYAASVLKIARYLKNKLPQAALAAALTPPVKNPENFSEEGERTPIILRRNAALRLAAEKTGAHVLDLYSVLKDKGALCRDDGVHQTDAGYDLLAAECVKIYHQLLKQDGGLL